jgi:hypothetical protein
MIIHTRAWPPQDDMLADLVTRLKELQEEFKVVHKTVDQMRSSDIK